MAILGHLKKIIVFGYSKYWDNQESNYFMLSRKLLFFRVSSVSAFFKDSLFIEI